MQKCMVLKYRGTLSTTRYFFQMFFALAISIIINLRSPSSWALESDYQTVFGHIVRFVISGFFAVLVSSIANIYLFSKIKVLMKGKKFWVRNLIASASGGLILVFIIVSFGYSSVLNFKQMLNMFFSIYIFEFLYSCLLIWPSWKMSTFLKRMERIDVYDHDLNINHFFK